MKVEIKSVRDCCHAREDLKPIEGSRKMPGNIPEFVFCIYCGAHHEYFRFTDPAGGTDWEYRKMARPWEKASPTPEQETKR